MKVPLVSDDLPILYIICANSALKRRLNKERYGFVLSFLESLPAIWAAKSALLLFYPDQLDFISLMPTGQPFVAHGDIHFMDEAFSLGAADYLSSPLHIGEFRARVGRVFKRHSKLLIPGSSISIGEATLYGPEGSCQLNPEEANLFRAMINRFGERVSRSALREAIWPTLPENTRMVDTAISRLRKCLKLVSGASPAPQIKTIHGFGYMVCEIIGNESTDFSQKCE